MATSGTAKAAKLPTLVEVLSGQAIGILIGLAVLVVGLSLATPLFFTVDNLLNVLLQSATYIIVAIGMTFTIVTGCVDLSVGSVAAFSSVVMALAMKGKVPVAGSIAMGLVVGVACGVLNGVGVGWARLPAFIVTLATQNIVRGLALIATQGVPIYGFPKSFRMFGTGRIWGIPIASLISLLVFAVGAFVFTRTKIGHYATAIGGNEDATRLCGINVRKYRIVVYMISGFAAALAGVIITARLNTAEPLTAFGIEGDAIASVIMGGTSLSGGKGTVIGTVLGALVMAVLRNGMNLLSVQAYYQQVIMGIVILSAVFMDRIKTANRS